MVHNTSNRQTREHAPLDHYIKEEEKGRDTPLSTITAVQLIDNIA